jgi:large subunit ribosomal protein L35
MAACFQRALLRSLNKKMFFIQENLLNFAAPSDGILPEEAPKEWRRCANASRVLHIKHFKMPKVKTNSSAKKRFKVTGTGKITHQKSFKRHILTKKSKKRKRALGKDGVVAKANLDFVRRLLGLK